MKPQFDILPMGARAGGTSASLFKEPEPIKSSVVWTPRVILVILKIDYFLCEWHVTSVEKKHGVNDSKAKGLSPYKPVYS